MYLFAADDFNQALKRMKYMQQIHANRKQQAAAIDSTQRLIAARREALETQKQEKTALLDTEMKQKGQLDREKKDQDKMLSSLKSQESKVKKELAQKRKAKEKLEQAIAAIIRREIEEARKAAMKKGEKDVPDKDVFALTPEARKLTASFAGNKGALPWPVEKGIISGYFGEHAHPTLKGVKVKNDGIDILTDKGSRARAIFQGEVSGTIDLPGSGAAVIIRHGEYLSVYANLDRVFVKKGDGISTRQEIGVIGNDDGGNHAEINLQIWKGFSKLNPRQWIAGQ
jgi:septal ring factor EnvC (AmiA/AmiB activator)